MYHLFKLHFEKVYGQKEVQMLENAMKNAIQKFDKKEEVYEELVKNTSENLEPLLSECMEKICAKNMTGVKDHTPESLLTLSKFFFKLGDFRVTSELIWGCISLALKRFIDENQMKISIDSHYSKKRFAFTLDMTIGRLFGGFEACHSSYYTNRIGAKELETYYSEALVFMKKLRDIKLTDEEKKALQKENFHQPPPPLPRKIPLSQYCK